jgi:hypothetical protein
MPQMMAPPPCPPRVTVGDDDSLRRLRLRFWQLWVTALTVLATAWFCTMGAIPAILALMVAKHVLVAVLAQGLGVDKVPSDDALG